MKKKTEILKTGLRGEETEEGKKNKIVDSPKFFGGVLGRFIGRAE